MRFDGSRWRRPGLIVLAAAMLSAPLGLALTGCVATGAKFKPAFAAEGEAVIYVFRRGGPLRGGPVDVVINQQPVLPLGRNEYLAYGVPPGEHLIRVEGGSSAAARVALRAGESVFVEVVTGALGGNPDLEVRQEEEGRLLIEGTREAPLLR